MTVDHFALLLRATRSEFHHDILYEKIRVVVITDTEMFVLQF